MANGDAARSATAHEFSGSTSELLAEIAQLTERTRAHRDPDAERRLLRLRHLAGVRLTDKVESQASYPTPNFDRVPEGPQLPEFQPSDLSPSVLRAAILRYGCMLVRGLVDTDEATRFANKIDHAFKERAVDATGRETTPGYYEPFQFAGPYRTPARSWIEKGGALLAIDSPTLAFDLMELFAAGRVPELVAGYLGEMPVISAQKTTLRKVEPSVKGAWHQDGSFMGDVRSLNLWVALSHCGVDAPSLDIVPRRLEALVPTGTDDHDISIEHQVSQRAAEEAAGDTAIVRPIFRPGDAVFFDELCLHQTGAHTSMSKARFAIESWFFGGSAFAGSYAPFAVS